MELTCTKKLLEYLGVKAEKMPDAVNPLFEWTANLLTINRRKTLVVVHAPSRCGFVLHGLRARDLPKLPELILDGVRGLLESEFIRPDIIERYLDDLGRVLTLQANSSRKAVARCNKVCERLQLASEQLDPEQLLQKDLLPWLNYEVLLDSSYTFAYEALLGALQKRYGQPITACRALELEVELLLHTPCKRRIIVPEKLNFDHLHFILQDCFAWENDHLHQFILRTDARGIPTERLVPAWDELDGLADEQVRYTKDVTLGEVFASSESILYEYDFGDGWEHTIRLCRVIENCTEPYARCIMAVGDAPMEDCGGPDGYAHIMEVLQDENHPEYHEISMWVGGPWPH